MVYAEMAAYILSACICAFSAIAAYRDRNLKIGFKIFIVCWQAACFVLSIACLITTLSELL